MAAHSPASSPRLPSPPPIAEDQVGPMSPGFSLFEDHGKLLGSTVDTGALRRIRPGTKAEDMAEGPPLVELQDIDSAFQLTEHLKALHYSHTHPADSHTTHPITADIARQLAQPPPNTAREIWLYELARFLIQKTNAIIVALFADTPPCSAHTCPEMRASEWQYLCAVHDPPKSCSAIDYCCHTLDWAATTLTSSKMFPSRLGLGAGIQSAGGGGGNDKVLLQQMKEITNIFRRVYRIYAHAWFQHREMFWRVEGKTGLYVLFKTVCDEYGMIQTENYTIPPEAEGLEPPEQELTREEGGSIQAPTLLRKDDSDGAGLGLSHEKPAAQQEPMGNTTLAAGDTTKRHRHTMSDRASSVTTVIPEEAEEDEEPQEETELSLEKQATSLRDFAESLPQPGQHGNEEVEAQEEQGENEEPVPGLARTGTLKPTKEAEEPAAEEEDEDEGEGETTVVEPEPEAEQDEDKIEPMEPSEAPAADGEEAGKTVGD
ncbi:hypothetical protein LTR36_010228 [Oleoguttula mirabilis]|uniref:Mob1/phocein n=1 Tax=Oleoguttula mirabilis TaxID=1507867 RepID=A0AAV9JRX8_9PEZI|nr:hypothetical protein LTR36_010228 [Oleoguttula mirabilis]